MHNLDSFFISFSKTRKIGKNISSSLFLIFFGGLGQLKAETAEKKPLSKPKVIYQEITKKPDVEQLIFPAQIEAKVSSQITSEIDAYVKKIVKPLGSKVSKNEVVLYIENKDPAFTYSQVAVRAPIGGIVSQIEVKDLMRVQKGQKLFSIILPDSIKASFEIPASQVAKMAQITKGVFRTNQMSQNDVPIKLTGLSPVVDARTGTASAEIDFDLKKMRSEKLTPPLVGMIGQVIFENVSEKIMTVPESAVSYFEGKPVVRIILDGNRVQRRPITIKETREEVYVVKNGLEEGSKVVVRSSRSLKEGEEVEAENGSVKTNGTSSSNK